MGDREKFWEFLRLAATIEETMGKGGLIARISYRVHRDKEPAKRDLRVAVRLLNLAFERLESYEFSDPDLVEGQKVVLEKIRPGVVEVTEIARSWVGGEPEDWSMATSPVTKDALLRIVDQSYRVS